MGMNAIKYAMQHKHTKEQRYEGENDKGDQFGVRLKGNGAEEQEQQGDGNDHRHQEERREEGANYAERLRPV